MVWFRVDDSLPTHHRVIAAGNAAMGLWVRCGAWSMGQLTDGFVPSAVALMFGSRAEVRRLLDVGLWTETDGGYRFHAWNEDGTGTKRQPTRDEVEEKRRAETERKAEYRDRQKRAGNGRYVPGLSQRDNDGTDSGTDAGTPAGRPPLPTRPDPYTPSPLRSEGGAPPVHNPGEDPEPAVRCPAHAGIEQPPRCGTCKDARLAHDAWEARQQPAAPAPRPPRWDPLTHCEHGQLHGSCDACAYEAAHAAQILTGRFGTA